LLQPPDVVEHVVAVGLRVNRARQDSQIGLIRLDT
jgi:hypothetical protein